MYIYLIHFAIPVVINTTLQTEYASIKKKKSSPTCRLDSAPGAGGRV